MHFNDRFVWRMRKENLLLTGLLLLPVMAQAELNDTGIVDFGDKSSYTLKREPHGHPGQDARFGRDAAAVSGQLKKVGGGAKGFDFTKLDDKGQPQPADADAWHCVRDNVTGLIWEVKTSDGSLRDASHIYGWYDPNHKTNGGHPGEPFDPSHPNDLTNEDFIGRCGGGIFCNTHAYIQAVNVSKLCGFSDWRLPTRVELRSLVDYSKSGRAGRGSPYNLDDPATHRGSPHATIDTDYFPNTPYQWFWSSTPYAINSEYAWRVYFYDGGDANGSKFFAKHVRLVRDVH